MAMYLRHFTVRGRGEFPLDMLRYDACWPRTGEDVVAISPCDQQAYKNCSKCEGKGFYPDPNTLRGHHCEECGGAGDARSVQLCRYTATKRAPVATTGRWDSFTWTVVKED